MSKRGYRRRNRRPRSRQHAKLRIVGETDAEVFSNFEYLFLDKVVSVYRSGGVLVETRHRFRSTIETTKFAIPHKIWRVSKELPEVDDLLNGSPTTGGGFLQLTPLRCGTEELNSRSCRIKRDKATKWGFERKFFVEFTNVHIRPGEEFEYEIVWGYDGAFHNRDNTDSNEETPNSVGLTTDGRGKVRAASLTLNFQRDLDGEPDRTIENPPTLFTADTLDFPGAHDPEEFFHKKGGWKRRGEMERCRQRTSTLFDVYQWSTSPFQGMVKAIWTPHFNYFNLGDVADKLGHDQSRPLKDPASN